LLIQSISTRVYGAYLKDRASWAKGQEVPAIDRKAENGRTNDSKTVLTNSLFFLE